MMKGVVIGTASALALAAAGQASAVTMQAGDTELQVYGYASFKAAYDFNEDLGNAVYANLGDVGDNSGNRDGYFHMSPKQSRLGFATSTETDNGTVKTRIEGDMLGGGYRQGSYRLRHAYGEWNGILAGQTWSNYNTFVGVTPTIDFDNNVGTPGSQFRNSQLRYTMGGFSVALEDAYNSTLSDSVVDQGGNTIAVKHSLPDLSAKYEGAAGDLKYSVAGIVQRTESVADSGANSDAYTGMAGFAAASYALGATTTLNGAVNYSDGMGAYLVSAPGAYAKADGSYETVKVTGGTVGIEQKMGMGSLNLSYGLSKVSDSDKIPGQSQKDLQTAFLNYMWSPVTNVTFGVEYGYFRVKDVNDNSESANRISFASQFNF